MADSISGFNLKIVETSDGSSSLFDPGLMQTYHSVFGALTESIHVYIENGLKSIPAKSEKLKVLEIGFGTGMNAMLLKEEADSNPGLFIEYTGLEPHLVPESLISLMKFPEKRNTPLGDIHRFTPGIGLQMGKRFSLRVIEDSFEKFQCEQQFDLIFYDAFSPDSQPELWSDEMLKKSVFLLRDGGVWVSYCSKGDVRRSLLRAGLNVERLPGPPGKRHMLRGIKPY